MSHRKDSKKMAAAKHRRVGIGAINGDSSIHSNSINQLKRKGKSNETKVEEPKFGKTSGSNTSLVGVGAINGNNNIEENSFNELTTIDTGDQKDVIIIERDKNTPEKQETGSNNELFGIGAINGNNKIGKNLFGQLTTIRAVEQGKRKETDQLKEETKGSNKRFGIGKIGFDNTISANPIEELERIPQEEKNKPQTKKQKK